MYFEDDTPTPTGKFATDGNFAKPQTGELAANFLHLAFLWIHPYMDASSDLVVGDIVSV
jgi:hypothetical protein